jgi:hypothetical protein
MSTVSPETLAAIAIIVAAGSELIAISPLKSNSWIQLLLTAARMAFPKRKS